MAVKRKNMFQEKDPTVFLFGSMVTSIHIVLPFVKVLSKLGTVKVQTEDKSFLVLSKEYEKEFDRGNVSFVIKDEPIMFEDVGTIVDKNYRFNVLVVQEYIPDINFDLFFFQHPVTFFKNQIPANRRHTPLFSVYDFKQHPPEMRKFMQDDLFVNETQLQLKSFLAFEPMIYRYTDVHSFDGKLPEQVVTTLYMLFKTFTKYSRLDIVKIFKEEVFNAHPGK